MNLSTLIVLIIVGVILFILIASGKARSLIKAFFNLFVEDIAATPEGAEALFNQKEEEVNDKFRRADEVYKKTSGKKQRCAEELTQLKARLTTIEADCQRLAQTGNENGLDIKIQERSDVIEEINIHTQDLALLEAATKEALEARSACEANLAEIRKKKKQVVSSMKRNRDMKAIYQDLEGIGADDHTSKLLERVTEKSTDMADYVAGSKQAYESRTSTKAQRLNQELKHSADDEYKKQLLAKYKK